MVRLVEMPRTRTTWLEDGFGSGRGALQINQIRAFAREPVDEARDYFQDRLHHADLRDAERVVPTLASTARV